MKNKKKLAYYKINQVSMNLLFFHGGVHTASFSIADHERFLQGQGCV